MRVPCGAKGGRFAEPFEHADQALLGEGSVAQRVAGAVEADNEAVTDQHVVANTFHIDDVLDARGALRRHDDHGQQAGKGGKSRGNAMGRKENAEHERGYSFFASDPAPI